MACTAPSTTMPSFEHTLELATHKLRMLPAPRSDARACAIIFDEAFSQDSVFAAMHGTADHDACVEKSVAYFDNDWETPGRRWFKIVDENNGKIAAFGKWWFPHTPAPTDPNAPKPTYLDGENKDISEYFKGSLRAGREKYVTDKENMYFMNIIGVRPEYQRLGLGAALLAPVLRQADQEGRKTYIEASAKGLGLYKKFGWKEVETLECDLTKCKGFEEKPVHKTVFMVREPGAGGPGL